ncbi:Hypothetical protein A7982_11344 [Minicystis rosea]|nr:Hypothetical protein A7982_11344 [Minicystis rosea]
MPFRASGSPLEIRPEARCFPEVPVHRMTRRGMCAQGR